MQLPPNFIGQINGYYLKERLLTAPWGVLFSGRLAGTFCDCVVYLVTASRVGVDIQTARGYLRSWGQAFESSPYHGRACLLLPAGIEKVSLGAELNLKREDSPDQPVSEDDYVLVYAGSDAAELFGRPGLAAAGLDQALGALRRVCVFLSYASEAGISFHGPTRDGISQTGERILLSDPCLFPRQDPDRSQGSETLPASPATWDVTPEEQRRCLAALLVEALGNSNGRALAELQALSPSSIAEFCPGLSLLQAELITRALRVGVSADELGLSQFINQIRFMEGPVKPGKRVRLVVLLAVCIGAAGAVFLTLGRVLG